MTLKRYVKETIIRSGYDVRRRGLHQLGFDPFKDMQLLTPTDRTPVLFDVGANTGQTVNAFREYFAAPIIHAFEPSPSTYAKLQERTGGTPDLHLSNIALGAQRECRVLIENSVTTLTSLLEPGEACWGEVRGQINVDVHSIDSYCQTYGVTCIDVLKSDTQGFDLEVLKGGVGMLHEHRIRLVFIELNFFDLYVGMPHFEDVYDFLRDCGFAPVAFYNQNIRNSRLGWMDGLFIDSQYRGTH
jgi:FkbM family methyltransferase